MGFVTRVRPRDLVTFAGVLSVVYVGCTQDFGQFEPSGFDEVTGTGGGPATGSGSGADDLTTTATTGGGQGGGVGGQGGESTTSTSTTTTTTTGSGSGGGGSVCATSCTSCSAGCCEDTCNSGGGCDFSCNEGCECAVQCNNRCKLECDDKSPCKLECKHNSGTCEALCESTSCIVLCTKGEPGSTCKLTCPAGAAEACPGNPKLLTCDPALCP